MKHDDENKAMNFLCTKLVFQNANYCSRSYRLRKPKCNQRGAHLENKRNKVYLRIFMI